MLTQPAGGMEKVVCISAAKVPIVKIWDPELGLACDMNVNNTVALENTRMVRIYVETDPRVRQLAMMIKYWTRRRIVNDAGRTSHFFFCRLLCALLRVCANCSYSLWRYSKLLHVDMLDYSFSSTSKSVRFTFLASTAAQDAQIRRRR